MILRDRIAALIKGDVLDDAFTRAKYSRDTSIFERSPKVVVFPKNADDVSALVKFVNDARDHGENLSVTARSAGTDMTGGPLTDSISVVFTKYMNHIIDIGPDPDAKDGTGYAVAEPGVYYRDLEKESLAKYGTIYPAYPASRDLCAIGGIVSNNSAGELNLRYGKTDRHVRELDVVLSDGSHAQIQPISLNELAAKEKEATFEGRLYKQIHALIDENREEIEKARPTVTKNSAGYGLWNVIDEKKGIFDLNQLIVGSQGTLAFVTRAKLEMVKTKPHRAMLVVFLADLHILPEIVTRVLAFDPESFESYDDKTFSLAVRLMPRMLSHMGPYAALKLGLAFIPDIWTVIRGGVPKLILLAEFAEDSGDEAVEKARMARHSLEGLAVSTRIAKSEAQSAKYWKVRRESFALLRKNFHGRYAAPFIDDIVVHVEDYPKFLPELENLVRGHRFIYTIAGHIGDGNFHIIPLVKMNGEADRKEMLELMPKVYALVGKYRGSITGEHNDGIIRTPYLPTMFSPRMIELFAQIKHIFDPLGVFNPGKKTGGTFADIERSMIKKI
ncbi:FAD-binding oxidoreductase [Candidatus Kaiserbacteria bacterium]|nr:FAD-binding oxidoreductase [Candidatus Kaiserbacteria bacterium]